MLAVNGNQLFRELLCYSVVDIRQQEESWADCVHFSAWLHGIQHSNEQLRVANIAIAIDCPRDGTV
jgi:hypothetical protein